MNPKPFVLLILLSVIASACKAKPVSPDTSSQIATAVAATIAAIPTCTPYPSPTFLPPPTPPSLNGLFCEYGFCIGHPEYLTPFDLNAASAENRVPSTYAGGKLIAYSADSLLLIVWQAGVTDLQYMLSVISQAVGGTLSGSTDIRLFGPYNVFYQPVQPPEESTLPYGAAAAWKCGERAFAWLMYTAQEGVPDHLLDQTLSRFTCGE